MRRTLLGVVAVAVAVAVVTHRTWISSDPADTTELVTSPAKAAAPVAVGPRSERFGVAQGWSRDDRGARAAAVSAVALTGDIARAGFVTRADMIGALASARFTPILVRASATQLADLVGDLPARGVPAGAVLFRELPLTARVVSADADTARVLVWAVLVVGVPDGGAPRQLWRTVTVDLVWEAADWRIDRWTAAPGPTPALATNAPIATVADFAEVTAWPPAGGN